MSDRRADAIGAAIASATAETAPGAAALGLGLLAATACFTATFRGPRDRFWARMTFTGLSLGSAALLVSGLFVASEGQVAPVVWRVLGVLVVLALLNTLLVPLARRITRDNQHATCNDPKPTARSTSRP